jgi:hypothetical protein
MFAAKTLLTVSWSSGYLAISAALILSAFASSRSESLVVIILWFGVMAVIDQVVLDTTSNP